MTAAAGTAGIVQIYYIRYIRFISADCGLNICSTAGFPGPGRGRGRAEIIANSISSQATVEKTDVEQEIIFCSRAAMMTKSEHSTAQHRKAQ